MRILFKSHAGSGWFGPPLGTHLPSSKSIESLGIARAYYLQHFGGKTHEIVVHAKSGDFGVSVFFDEMNNHAYTEDEYVGGKKTGRRVFDKNRAVLMDRILSAIEHPSLILQSSNKDLFIERIDGQTHYLIALTYSSSKKRYEFSSAHDRPTSEILAMRRALRPTPPKGKPLTKSIKGLDSAFEKFGASPGAIAGDPLGLHTGSGHNHSSTISGLLMEINGDLVEL